ncbi:hypothetical protein ACFYW6_38480 [Streptomyces sp. NPDC002659]|uniref:hypothetical protein n=1 Tax=Streptomyces sp. NPDC002659 TaxID=3364656 RepID=UPI0036BB466E
MLDRIDEATVAEQRLNIRIEEHIRPYLQQIELLATIPGVSAHTAQVIVADIGADITRLFVTGSVGSSPTSKLAPLRV